MLDVSTEVLFDRLTALATKVLRTPVAFVTFLETDRQVFHGRCVLSGPLLHVHETPISHSICHLVASNREPVVISDTREHPLVRLNPAVEGGKVYAYAGVPIFDATGAAVGAFCAIDHEPHHWTAEDVDVLHTLAAQVMSDLTLRASMQKLEKDIHRLKQTEDLRSRLHREDRHDLRTPLNAMMLGLQAVRLMGDLNDEQSEYLALAEHNGAALAGMVDKMLDIANIENRGAEAIHCSVWQLSDLVSTAVNQVSLLAEGRHIALHQEPLPIVSLQVDHDKIIRVLVNLLGNAIKFTPLGGQVAIAVEVIAEELQESGYRFAISDNGVGMAPEVLPQIFDEGFRVNPASTTKHSTGLGLTFCKRVVEAHGGRIWVDSVLREGSTFYFTLPNHS